MALLCGKTTAPRNERAFPLGARRRLPGTTSERGGRVGSFLIDPGVFGRRAPPAVTAAADESEQRPTRDACRSAAAPFRERRLRASPELAPDLDERSSAALARQRVPQLVSCSSQQGVERTAGDCWFCRRAAASVGRRVPAARARGCRPEYTRTVGCLGGDESRAVWGARAGRWDRLRVPPGDRRLRMSVGRLAMRWRGRAGSADRPRH
jgi:hypothetical protein